MDGIRNRSRAVVVAAVLCLLTLGTFWPVFSHDFINYDDPDYVTENPHVQRGLTWAEAVWALRTRHAGNWHPVTWLSHMLDGQLYGLKPGGHHSTSLLLHTANTLLLFVVLRRMTAALWPSAFVAALFGLHPLHVESVAWVAERKDVLSTFFCFLTIWVYTRFVDFKVKSPPTRVPSVTSKQRRTIGMRSAASPPATGHPSLYYSLALLLFLLSLMSKPMLVTLPFVLLLLDYWPLRRFQIDAQLATHQIFLRLVKEKVPFFLLSAISSGLTFCVQQRAGAVGECLLTGRIGNAVISYARYVGKVFWPENLAVFYPRPAEWPIGMVFGTAAFLLVISALALWFASQRPYLAVGWFWFLGTLMPVIGIVQVGEQSMADRYTYFPVIGLFIIIAWGAAEMTVGRSERGRVGACAAAVVVAACILCTLTQLRHWQTSESLFKHALAVTTNNAVAHNNLGAALDAKGDFEQALMHYSEALRIQTNYPDAQVNLGIQLARQGRIEEALSRFHAALALNSSSRVEYNLGNALLEKGDWNEAAKHLVLTLEKEPDFAEAHYNLALALLMQGHSAAAASHYREAVRLKPDWPAALKELAWILATDPSTEIRNGAEAVDLAERACVLTGHKEASFLVVLDVAYAEAGRFEEAARTAERVRELALASGKPAIAQAAEQRLTSYQARKSYRQP
jgi:protein O-mannosyl-transferase